jgi:hypothetical protein
MQMAHLVAVKVDRPSRFSKLACALIASSRCFASAFAKAESSFTSVRSTASTLSKSIAPLGGALDDEGLEEPKFSSLNRLLLIPRGS